MPTEAAVNDSGRENPAYTVRLRFCRSEPAIWLAHLDMMRTFERALRRAGLPLAYSQGFNPRPRITFALPIGVGLATEDDYLDITLVSRLDNETIIRRLNEKLPAGLEIARAAAVDENKDSIMSRVAAAEYEIEAAGIAAAIQAAADLPEEQTWQVVKKGKKGPRNIDIKPLLLASEILDPDIIRVLVRAGSRDNLRPDLLLSFLSHECGLDELAAADAGITRIKLLLDNDGRLESPLP